MRLFFEILLLSLKSLRANRLRSGLSTLGIIIGVFTIVVVVAIGNAVTKGIDEQFRFLNVTTIVVWPVNTTHAKSKLSSSDLKFIAERSKYVSIGTEVFFGRSSVVYRGKEKQYNLLAGNENFPEALPLGIQNGRFFSPSEAVRGERVAVIGKLIVDEVFGEGSNPVGKEALIGGKIFRIVGTIVPSGGVGPFSFDDSIIIPIATSDKFLSSSSEPKPMIFLAKDVSVVALAMEELKTLLRESHRIKSGADDDFSIQDQGTILVLARGVAAITRMLLIGVGSIVLIVSGIGIMNVMFAGVAERRREIGIALSIWARKHDVLLQFLIESIVLTIIGGILGVILAEGGMALFNSVSSYRVIPSLSGIVIALGFAVVTGIFFWIYPAKRASDLDPVDALK